MTRSQLLTLAALGLLLAGLSTSSGQLPPAPSAAGRYTVVHVEPNPLRILLLDTATGDIYAAGAEDIKDYDKRPRFDPPKLIRPPIKDQPAPDPRGKIELKLTPEEIDRFIKEGDKK